MQGLPKQSSDIAFLLRIFIKQLNRNYYSDLHLVFSIQRIDVNNQFLNQPILFHFAAFPNLALEARPVCLPKLSLSIFLLSLSLYGPNARQQSLWNYSTKSINISFSQLFSSFFAIIDLQEGRMINSG
jgi:hypothetical protein